MTQNLKFADVKEFLAEIGKMGEKEATGLTQRAEFAVSVAIAAAEGHINGTPKDALDVWTRYRAKHKNKLGTAVKDVERSEKIRASETLQIIKCGLLPNADFAATLESARAVISTADFIKGNTWDNMIKLARFQLKPDQEGRKLSPAEVEAALTPVPAAEKDELAQLKAVIKAMERIAKGSDGNDTAPARAAYPSAELEGALELVQTRVAMLELRVLDAERAKKMRALGIAA